MKRIITVLLLLISVFVLNSSVSFAQLQRNPVLEYCTGTWCGYCPCGHDVIRNVVLPNIPNTIVIGYHGPANGSDPFSYFDGNSIISSLGFSAYPTGIIDRVTGIVSRGSWYSYVFGRTTVNAGVDIDILKTYNTSTRQLNITVNSTALTNLTGDYNVNVILLEDGMIASQTGYSQYGCYGSSTYRHEHVVRSMLNGPLGELMNTGGAWNQAQVFSKVYSYTIPTTFIADSCHLAIFVYKVGSPLNSMGEIQQAKQWTLIGDIVPVELTSFTASVDKRNIILSWTTATEQNNQGFAVERSADGVTYSAVGFVKGNGTTTEKQFYSFTDKPEANGLYYYRLKQQDYDGKFSYSDVILVKLDIPLEFALDQNYPNPFNPATTISFSVAEESFVSLSVYDLMGQEIASLVKEMKQPGKYDVSFDAAGLSSGTYIYKINAGTFTQSKKLVVLK